MTLRYVALGDSVAAGFRAAPGWGYVAQLYRHLWRRNPIWRLANLSSAGATTRDLRRQVRRALLWRPDLVTLDIGGNDLRHAGPDPVRIIPYSMANLDAALGELRRGSRAAVFVADVYNPLPPGSRFHRAVEAWVGEFNRALAGVAARHGCRVVGIHAALARVGRGAIAPDLLHPTTTGHTAIADAFRRAGV
jgi:lysophospholipase L1-like esterase